MNGVITIACGNKYYGKLAYNLALSVVANTGLPVSVITDGNALISLTDAELSIFDKIIQIDCNWANAKLQLPQLSLYEKTIFIDADTVVINKDLAKCFDMITKEQPLLIITEGHIDMVTDQQFKDKFYHNNYAYPLAKKLKLKGKILYSCRSEFIVFDDSKKSKQLFAKAHELYNSDAIQKSGIVDLFAGIIPDELGIDLAMCALDYTLPIYKFSPTYWPPMHGQIVPPLFEIKDKYFVFSIGGNRLPPAWDKAYHMVLDASAYKLKREYLKVEPKKEVLQQRKNF